MTSLKIEEGKRYSATEVKSIIDKTLEVLLQRRQVALPWSFSELKKTNNDLPFEFIQKRIKKIYNETATEFFANRECIFCESSQFTEQQLRKLVQDISYKSYKTIHEIRENAKGYYFEKASQYIEQNLHSQVLDYFFNAGIMTKDAYEIKELEDLQLNLDGFLKPHIMQPKSKKEVLGIDNENGCFSNCIFKGFTKDIKELMRKYCVSGNMESTDYFGISLLRCCDSESDIYKHYYWPEVPVEQVIKEFPELKFVGIFASFDGSVHSVYSEIGYSYLTDDVEIGFCDRHNDFYWFSDHMPDENFTDSEIYIISDTEISYTYEFPFVEEWNNLNYVTFIEGQPYSISDLQDFLSMSEKNNLCIQKFRYPFCFSFQTKYVDIKIGDAILLEHNQNEIDILDHKGRSLCSYNIDEFHRDACCQLAADWKYPPFSISFDRFKVLTREIKLISAKVVSVEKVEGHELNFVTIEIALNSKET